MQRAFVFFVSAVLVWTLPSGESQCTTSPYMITTAGADAGAPMDEDASLGVPFLPALESMKTFSIQATADSRIYLASSPRIATASEYIQIDFLVATNMISINVKGDTSNPMLPLTYTGNNDLDLIVSGTKVSINTAGTEIVSLDNTAVGTLDINFILVQTPTMSTSDTTMWIFCETDLMKLDPVNPPANAFDQDSDTCASPMPVTYLPIDLGGIFEIRAVLISAISTNLAGAQVLIGNCDHNLPSDGETIQEAIELNSACGSTITGTDADGMDYWILEECQLVGQFVYITNFAGDLTNAICEVEVWGTSSSTSSQLSFADVESTELESVAARMFTVERVGDSSSCAYFNLAIPSGTATDITDYTYVAADLAVTGQPVSRIDPMVTTKDFTVNVIDDGELEPVDETIVIQFDQSSLVGADIGTNTMTTLTIQNNDVCYEWDVAAYPYLENIGTATPLLRRSGYTTDASTACVLTSVTGVTPAAADGDDFTAIPSMTQVMFGAGELMQNVDVTITDDETLINADGSDDIDEMFKVVLETGSVCNGETVNLCVGGIEETVVTITDNDVCYEWDVAAYSYLENIGSAAPLLTRKGYTVDASTACVLTSVTDVTPAAADGDDFTAIPSMTQVMFGADELMQNVDVTITDDETLINADGSDDIDEMFKVVLETGTCNGETVNLCAGGIEETVVTITDNDVCYEWDTAAYSYIENIGSATPLLTRRGYTVDPSTACVATSTAGAGITTAAVEGDDFTALPSMTPVMFEANVPQQTVEIPITNDECFLNADGTNDFDEMFKVVLETVATCDGQTVNLCTGGNDETVITLTNDDALYSFQTIDPVTVTEADEDVTVVIQREGTIIADSPSITILTQPRPIPDPAFDTAIGGEDYVEPTMQVTIGAGLTAAPFTVVFENDNVVERDETFSLLLGSNLDMCAVDQTKKDKSINIIDNDCYYSFDGDDADGDNVIQKEVGEANGMIQLAIKCERNDDVQLEHSGYVDLQIGQITGKTAVHDMDFDSSGTTPVRVYFTPGSYMVDGTTGKDTALVSIDIYNDNVVETTADEMFEVKLVAASGEIGNGPTVAQVTIVDNDALVSLQDTSVTVSESESEMTIILNRSGDLSGTDTVRLVSTSQTATSGTSADNGDYMSINEVLTFNAGDTSATVSITLFDDSNIESSESFTLSVVPTSNLDLTVDPDRDELNVTIEDNDCLFSLEVDEDQLVVSETNNGEQPTVEATVRRNGFLDKVTSINLKTSSIGTPIVGRDDATPNADYIEINQQLVFQAGDTERTASINILNDDLPELSEVFMLYLEDPQCDIDGESRRIITIMDDDQIVIKMAEDKVTVSENVGEVIIPLVRTGSLASEDTVALSVVATSIDGNNPATPEADYQGGTYTAIFEANSGDTSISVPIHDDDFNEDSPETFVVKIDAIVGSDSAATVTPVQDERRTTVFIQDDDDIFNLKESNIYVSESTGTYTTYVEREGSANTLETVIVYTRDASATSEDYVPLQAMSLTFPPGTTSLPVTFQVINDKVEEPSQDFFLILASEDGSIVGRTVTTVTIQDDDFPISFKDGDAVVYVDEDVGTFTVTVQRMRTDNAAPGELAKVTVVSREAFSSNAASQSSDFDAVSREIDFPPSGTQQVDVTISIKDDIVAEEEETFEIYLTDPSPSSSHYIAYPNVITVNIRDDDGMPSPTNTPDGDGGGNLSQAVIILIGGSVGVAVLLGVLGIIGCFALSRMRSRVPPVGQGTAPRAYSSPAGYNPYRQRPMELRRQQPPMYNSNGGYRY